jgi:hypothetical protein
MPWSNPTLPERKSLNAKATAKVVSLDAFRARKSVVSRQIALAA